jgi:hypothetical protein
MQNVEALISDSYQDCILKLLEQNPQLCELKYVN